MAETKLKNETGVASKFLRIPPQSLPAEAACLGSIMIRPEAMNEIIDIVFPHSFYAERHRIVYAAMLELFGKGQPIDLLSISTLLGEKGELERLGGASFITELVDSVPAAANAAHYAAIVRKKHLLRELIAAAEHIANLGFNEEGELEEIIESAEKRIFEVSKAGRPETVVEWSQALAEAWERLDRLHKSRDELRGVPTGFKELDNLLAGFQKSDLIILAARPSMGKTALALDIARQTAVHHQTPVGIFSLEMSSSQLVDRMLAAESRVSAWHLRTGRISNEDDFGRIRDSLDRLSKAPIFIDDQPGINIIKMRSVARKLKMEKGLKLIIVDYLQLITPTNTRASDSEVQQITEISRSLKTLARELDLPILALSQLSRAVEQRGGRPRLSDLRSSGSIEQDADVVMFIHREDKYKEDSAKPNIAEILVEKHRNGPVGKVELYFDDRKATFLSLEKGDFSDFGQVSENAEGDAEF
jgi:replicative DNA helicase